MSYLILNPLLGDNKTVVKCSVEVSLLTVTGIGRCLVVVMVLLCMHAIITSAMADDLAIWDRSTLTGDWGGMRTDLSDRGVDISLRLSQYGQRVVTGGRDVNGEYGGTMDYRFNIDTNKLFGTWKGFSINMHARTRFGNDVLEDAGGLTLPNTGLLQPNPGDYHNTDITGLTVNQFFPLGETHIGLATLGKIDVIDAVTLFFPHVGYGQEGFFNTNAMVTALPWFGAVTGLSLYGGWLAAINNERQIGQSAVLALGTRSASTSWPSISSSFEEGVWLAAFHRFLYDVGDKPGYFMMFGGYSTRDQASNDFSDFIIVPGEGIESDDKKNPWNIAFYLSQQVWNVPDNTNRKVEVLIGGTVGPDNPQFAQYNLFTNVEAYGLFASRPNDRMGASVWHNWLSDDFVDLVSPVVKLRDTYGLDLYYNFRITEWAHVSADLQFVENEYRGDDLAVIPGARLVIDF